MTDGTSARRPWLRLGLAIVTLLVVYDLGMQAVYANRVFPGVRLGPLDLGGKTAAQAADLVAKQSQNVQELQFVKDNRVIKLAGQDVGLKVDAKASAEEAVNQGRQDVFSRLTTPFALLVRGAAATPLHYQLVDSVLADKLAAQTADLAHRAKNAGIVRTGTTFRITHEQPGTIVDPAANVQAARRSIESFESQVLLYIRPEQPEILAADLGQTRAYAAQLASAPLTVVAGDQRLTAPPATIAQWIAFEPRPRTVTMPVISRSDFLPSVDRLLGVGAGDAPIIRGSAKTLYAVADTDHIGQYVADVAADADKPAVNARVAFAGNQLVVQGQPKNGQVVDRAQAVRVLASSLKKADRTATLPVVSKPADIRQETLPKLGIKAQIGSATTNFPGSPGNRIFNIGVGATRFDGVLIKPGDTFSFDEVLGDVGPETGYRQELVILDKKTVPQYGGGLCQVSTTMFQAALKAGLPIVERTNHSYAVSYYSPLGMDATIYPGGPDMRFKNNTAGYILVQTRLEGTRLTFDLFGTPDGRQASTQLLSQNATTEAGGNASFRYSVAGGPEPINKVLYSSYQPHADFPVTNSLN